ncbi:hypothetical protein [Pseudohoeflea coraliihabitans]|uniref:Uncharacterized protein n=1 Tax=Pseudohoeflea coraliihabitans TaxID=2860393 RepID=A0ABS6WTW6_9HYPH|nr:hypothetical protein [Pseudohoeflea sp. DP4N28-3]MBW3098862.1 hypothetical protein [Pseudohoeflea sp. DP4N28-3]
MIIKAIDPPTLQLDVGQFVDWLELSALLNDYGIVRIDSLIGSLKQLSEEQEEDIAEADKFVEKFIEDIENEIEIRENHLSDTYPFKLDENAEELALADNWQDAIFSFYLVCLVASHVTGSPILNAPPSGKILKRLRNHIFQVLSTLAMAGFSHGPAISVGWPRRTDEVIIDILRRAAANGAGFSVRNAPGPYTPPNEKDGGIDVLAWTSGVTPPPTNLLWGQSASGNNWPEKPVAEHARIFEVNYLQDVMAGNRGYATIIPFRILDERFWNAQNLYHRSLIDRLRLPPYARSGMQQAASGVMIDEADQVDAVVQWLREYREAALA